MTVIYSSKAPNPLWWLKVTVQSTPLHAPSSLVSWQIDPVYPEIYMVALLDILAADAGVV